MGAWTVHEHNWATRDVPASEMNARERERQEGLYDLLTPPPEGFPYDDADIGHLQLHYESLKLLKELSWLARRAGRFYWSRQTVEFKTESIYDADDERNSEHRTVPLGDRTPGASVTVSRDLVTSSQGWAALYLAGCAPTLPQVRNILIITQLHTRACA